MISASGSMFDKKSLFVSVMRTPATNRVAESNKFHADHPRMIVTIKRIMFMARFNIKKGEMINPLITFIPPSHITIYFWFLCFLMIILSSLLLCSSAIFAFKFRVMLLHNYEANS
jgi:hypothetical protein